MSNTTSTGTPLATRPANGTDAGAAAWAEPVVVVVGDGTSLVVSGVGGAAVVGRVTTLHTGRGIVVIVGSTGTVLSTIAGSVTVVATVVVVVVSGTVVVVDSTGAVVVVVESLGAVVVVVESLGAVVVVVESTVVVGDRTVMTVSTRPAELEGAGSVGAVVSPGAAAATAVAGTATTTPNTTATMIRLARVLALMA